MVVLLRVIGGAQNLTAARVIAELVAMAKEVAEDARRGEKLGASLAARLPSCAPEPRLVH
jgi:hypothetical protein